MQELFSAGYALPRWCLGEPQSWIFNHMVYYAEKDVLPLEERLIGDVKMNVVKIEELLVRATGAKLNENLQSRVNAIKML